MMDWNTLALEVLRTIRWALCLSIASGCVLEAMRLYADTYFIDNGKG